MVSAVDLEIAPAQLDKFLEALRENGQPSVGKFEVPNWDPVSQKKIRDALSVLGTTLGDMPGAMFGSESEVNPISHLIGTAIGWGGNPTKAAIYLGAYPKANDGKVVHKLTAKNVPVDGFWSISLYNAKGFFQKKCFECLFVEQSDRKGKPGWFGHGTVRRLPEEHCELSADRTKLELHGAALPTPKRNHRRQLEVSRGATSEMNWFDMPR